MAHHDALTGLANRAAVAQDIESAAARHRRYGEPFTVLLLDLDRFKYVNDLRSAIPRATPLLARGWPCGGLNPSCATLTCWPASVVTNLPLFSVAKRCPVKQPMCWLARASSPPFTEPFCIEVRNELTIGTSIGIALAPEHAADPDNLLKMADMALYRAKSAGRNNFQFFDLTMSEAANVRHALESELRYAIQKNELELHYQPIIDTRTRKVCAAEALLRWRHPSKGLIAPDQFIPLAEETGLITQIGEWVLRTACAEAASWPAYVKVAVNLSPVQFRKSNLSEVVMAALAETGLSPARLELEITETALIESAADCLPALHQFKAAGIVVALDDFGTGYSSLSQLTLFPFDKIKIDKSFIQNITSRADCAAIIAATLTLAHGLNIATTAEGVETVEQYRLLRLAGVSQQQGYLFKRPGAACEIDFDAVFDVSGKAKAA